MFKTSFDESGLRKLLSKTHSRSEAGDSVERKRNSIDTASTSSLDIDEGSIASMSLVENDGQPAQFYVPLDDKEDPLAAVNHKDANTNMKEPVQKKDSTDKPFIILSQVVLLQLSS